MYSKENRFADGKERKKDCNELFLDLCDEQGILVWEENHARGLSEEQMRNPNFERQCEDCIREMIEAHYNHPCIYMSAPATPSTERIAMKSS